MGYWGNRKPPFGTRLNPDHPNSQGLVAFWPFNEQMGTTAYDVVRSGQAGLVLSTGINPWRGPNFAMPASADGVWTGAQSLPSYLQLQPPLSLVWQGAFLVTYVASATFFGLNYAKSNVAPFYTYALATDSGNGVIWSRNDAGTQRTLLSGVSPGSVGFGKNHQWAGTLTTGAAAMYLNSLSKSSSGSTAGSASITYNATGVVVSSGPIWNEFGAIYNRVIPTAQMDWMRVEPFDHFEAPAINMAVFDMASAGGNNAPLLIGF